MISTLLLNWYEENKRTLPWRDTSSPYKIWLSEIILQQTRVNQGLAYYRKFLDRFPEIEDLAKASVDDVLKLWQGLGYYTRARNLHATANLIVKDHGSNFPDSYEKLRLLQGIGDYTAAAIASFAYKIPVALVDGNVYRVIARLFDIHTPINTSAGNKVFYNLASGLLNPQKPDVHNQAIMEFGALVCLPRTPKCGSCVLADHCLARERGTASVLPVKKYRVTNRTRYFNYLFIKYNHYTWIRKREGRDIWNSLYEFPLIETTTEEDFIHLSRLSPWNRFLKPDDKKNFIGMDKYVHKLSHQQLICAFFIIEPETAPSDDTGFLKVGIPDLHNYAVPRIIDRYLQELVTKKAFKFE